jgi:hydrogenase expression/formation protein HypD
MTSHNFIDPFSSKEAVQHLARRIQAAVDNYGNPLTVMEVCGTHTMAISRFGLRGFLPPQVNLVSGPGCPVCVTPCAYIDRAVAMARLPDITIATFGDMMQVPGTFTTLQAERAAGADVRVVYSPLDALALAEKYRNRNIVFLGVGFETTAPTTAGAILIASRRKLENFFVLASHKTMPKAMAYLATDSEAAIDGFICPPHVSAVIGAGSYSTLSKRFGIPCVVAGFEPADILRGMEMLVLQKMAGRVAVENEYTRVVSWEGNRKAQEVMSQVFSPCDARWRGIGAIPGTGLKLRKAYAGFDAEKVFRVEVEEREEQKSCACGEILKGKRRPRECPLFGRECTPESPVGPCMVSTEGSCAAAYKYEEEPRFSAPAA